MKLQLLSLVVDTGLYQNFVKEICHMARVKTSSYICVANAHMLVEAHKDPAFAKVVNGADIVTPDGMPLCKAIHLLYGRKQERVAGMDLLPDLIYEAEAQALPVFFYGGSRQMLENASSYLGTRYPRLKIAGLYSPPFRKLSVDEECGVINMINNSGASLVFVALGCPKQENWMAGMKGKIHSCMIGIGGALPVMLGMQKRAPVWMQRSSLEWLYRLGQEPKRLFKRYAITNNIFLGLLFKQWLKQGFASIKINSTVQERQPGKYIRVSFLEDDQLKDEKKSNGTVKK